jgi:endonuclease G
MDVETELQSIIEELEDRYSGISSPVLSDPAAVLATPANPEAIIGRDERVRPVFFERAIRTGRSVALLTVPRIFDGVHKANDYSFGTGWLIAPNLMIINRHVIDARDRRFEPPARSSDFTAQGAATIAWFDYHQEGGTHQDATMTELVASDLTYDFALLSVSPTSAAIVQDRPPLPLIRDSRSLVRSDSINVVQYPGGGPLQYAIRSNYYWGMGSQSYYLHYLSDTERGASGSPVLDDTWQVLALHHAYRDVTPESFLGPRFASTTKESIYMRYLVACHPN